MNGGTNYCKGHTGSFQYLHLLALVSFSNVPTRKAFCRSNKLVKLRSRVAQVYCKDWMERVTKLLVQNNKLNGSLVPEHWHKHKCWDLSHCKGLLKKPQYNTPQSTAVLWNWTFASDICIWSYLDFTILHYKLFHTFFDTCATLIVQWWRYIRVAIYTT